MALRPRASGSTRMRPRSRRPTGVRRLALLRLLVAVALVALAAVGLRLSEGQEGQNFQVVRGRLGEPVAINGGTVTASQVRVGTSLTDQGEAYATTPGLFVVVRVEVAATGRETVRAQDTRVVTKRRRYDSFSASLTGEAAPGFATAEDAIFEVDPADLADLTLELDPGELVSGYAQHTRIHLGITRGNAERWRAAGQHQVVEILTVPSVRGI
jgi:hypothetical protein